MKTAILTPAELLDLAENLQHLGFTVEIRQLLDAQRLDSLLLALAGDGEHLTAERLRRLLAPVFCTSAEEQETFYAFFDDWLARKAELRQRLDTTPTGAKGGEEAGQKRPRRRWPWFAAAAAIALAFAAGWYLGLHETGTTPDAFPVTLHVRDASDSTALAGAAIALPADTFFTDSAGTLRFDAVPRDSLLGFSMIMENFLAKRVAPFAVSDTIEQSYYLVADPGPQRLTGRVSSQADQIPIRGATVRFLDTEATTDNRGAFGFDFQAKDSSASLAVRHPDFKPHSRSLRLDGRATAASLDIELAAKDPPEVDSLRALVTRINAHAAQAERDAQPAAWQLFLREHKFELQLAGLTLPVLAFLVWLLLRWRRRRLLLQKQATPITPRVDSVLVHGVADYLFRTSAFRRTIQQLRQHEEVASPLLNAAASVDATIARGGLFTPVYASRYRLPEYLILIERASFSDQHARLLDGLVDRMAHDGVVVDRYYFDGDPRVCWPEKAGGAQLDVHDLLRRHPQHRLLIFSSGSSLIDPQTGRPYLWLDTFLEWQHSAIFMPDRTDGAAFFEQQFRRLGFAVGPASTGGLAGHAEGMGLPGQRRPTEWERRRRFPRYLETRIDRWLQRLAPEQDAVERLIVELRLFLEDDGFDWLCACAVYPELHWELTLFLATKLTLGDEHTLTDEQQRTLQARLSDLTRLPWLREGAMPDWLRLRLIAAMQQGKHDQVRRILRELLQTARDPDGEPGGIELHYAQRSLRDVVRGRLRRRRQPVKDYIFANYMSSRRPGLLSVLVPRALQRLIYRHGQPLLGLRPLAAAAFAALFALGAWSGIEGLQPAAPGSPIPYFEPELVQVPGQPQPVARSREPAHVFVAAYLRQAGHMAAGESATHLLQERPEAVAEYHAHLENELIAHAGLDTARVALLPRDFDELMALAEDTTDLPWLLALREAPVDTPSEPRHASYYVFWLIFGVIVLLILTFDFGGFHRSLHVFRLKEALIWSTVWVAISLIFCAGIYVAIDKAKALDFLAVYLIGKSLCAHILVVFLLIFSYLNIPRQYQHRVLFWVVLVALLIRAVMIAAGLALIQLFHWIIYISGAILVFTGIKMARDKDTEISPEKNPFLNFIRRYIGVTKKLYGERFFIRNRKAIKRGRYIATPLFVALVVVEATDVLFAIVSIPAMLAITFDPFIVYTSSIFAILGLRALYVVLAGMMPMFHYLHYGLSGILVYVGLKMLISDFLEIPVAVSLGFIVLVLAASILVSLFVITESRDIKTTASARHEQPDHPGRRR